MYVCRCNNTTTTAGKCRCVQFHKIFSLIIEGSADRKYKVLGEEAAAAVNVRPYWQLSSKAPCLRENYVKTE